jgi:hypothetical protein
MKTNISRVLLPLAALAALALGGCIVAPEPGYGGYGGYGYYGAPVVVAPPPVVYGGWGWGGGGGWGGGWGGGRGR